MRFLRRIRLSFVILLGMTSCGRGPSPGAPREAAFSPAEGSEERKRIEIVHGPERPTLQLVHRSGDPEGGVAMAVFVEGGSRSVVALLALLTHRLEAVAGLDVRAFSSGVVVSTLTSTPKEAKGALARFQRALEAPVQRDEPAVAHADRLLGLLPQGTGSAVDRCLGVLGSDGPKRDPYSSRELESIRAEHAVSMRVGFGALGDPALLQATLAAHQKQIWKEGTMVPVQGAERKTIEAHAGPSRQIRVALRTPRVTQALLVVEELARDTHPLRAHLGAESGRFRLEASGAAVQPWGACLSLHLEQEARARAPRAQDLAALIRVSLEELRLGLDVAQPRNGNGLTLLTPENALDALALAAWTAPPSESISSEEPIAEVVLGQSDGVPAPAIESAFREQLGKKMGQRLELLRRDEAGQGRSYLLVGSPCGTGPESLREAGFRALTVRSLALDFNGLDDVTVEPWATASGMGLFGHASRRAGESPRNHAMRIARALGRALAGDALDGREVATARSELIEEVGDDPGSKLTLEILSGGRPTLLDVRGNSESLSAASSIDVERVRAELVSEPLRIAFLDSSGADLSEAVREALGLWLDRAHETKTRCPAPELGPARPGVWTIVSPSEGVTPRTYVGVPSNGAGEAGHALAFLLNRERGSFARGLLEPRLALTVSSRYMGAFGQGSFLFELGAERDRLDAAEGQLRAILDRVVERGISDEELRALEDEQTRREREMLRLPHGRIVALFTGRRAAPILKRDLEAHLRHLKASEHRVIRVRTER